MADTIMLVVLFCLRLLQGAYDASQHPGVISKRRTEEDVMEEFLSTFEGEVKDGKVTCSLYTRVQLLASDHRARSSAFPGHKAAINS